MSDGLIPTLDGKRVLLASEDASGRQRYVHEDGTAIAAERAGDIVYTQAFASTSSEREPPPAWWAAVKAETDLGELLFADAPDDEAADAEVASWLMAVGQSHRPQATVQLDAGFFHSTLRAWLGESDGPSKAAAWDYSFWKAELFSIDFDDDTVPKGARVFEAKVWLGEDTPPDFIRYFIAADEGESADGASAEPSNDDATGVTSGWLSPPPDLLRLSGGRNSGKRADSAAATLDIEALFNER